MEIKVQIQEVIKMNEMNIIDETMENVVEEVAVEPAKSSFGKKALGVALVVGGVVLARKAYKKVVKPKLEARKAKKAAAAANANSDVIEGVVE